MYYYSARQVMSYFSFAFAYDEDHLSVKSPFEVSVDHDYRSDVVGLLSTMHHCHSALQF